MLFEQDEKLCKQDIKSFEQHIKSSEQAKKIKLACPLPGSVPLIVEFGNPVDKNIHLLDIDPRKRGIDVGAILGWVSNDIAIIAILL